MALGINEFSSLVFSLSETCATKENGVSWEGFLIKWYGLESTDDGRREEGWGTCGGAAQS